MSFPRVLRLARLLLAILLGILPVASPADLPGDACLPKDVVNLLSGDLVLNAGKACRRAKKTSNSCSSECRDALYALKAARCYQHISQPQRLQPRASSVSLSAMAGRWYGAYPASGLELLEMEYDASTSTLRARKLTGNNFVPAGQISWEATPVGCKIASSMYAGRFTVQWDRCSLTMVEHDEMLVDLGAESDTLTFVRAKLPLLLAWDDEHASTRGLLSHFEMCDIPTEEAAFSIREWAMERLHHSWQSVIVDQALAVFPFVLLAGWQRGEQHRPVLLSLSFVYLSVLSSRLAYIGLKLPFL